MEIPAGAEPLEIDPRLRRVKAYFEADVSRELSLGQAAGIAGLSRAYFSSYFHRKTGKRFTEWIHGVRVDRAMGLIQAGHSRLTDVARRTGYRSLRTFQRAFRKHAGQTPLAYRVSVRPTLEKRGPAVGVSARTIPVPREPGAPSADLV